MKPSFDQMERNLPKSEKREGLYEQIGWSDLTSNPSFYATCAIRMSVALLRAGVKLSGARMVAKEGRLKGRRIETGPGQAFADPETGMGQAGSLPERTGRPGWYRQAQRCCVILSHPRHTEQWRTHRPGPPGHQRIP